MGRPSHSEIEAAAPTTRELLAELAGRMQRTQNSTKGRELGQLCSEAMENLASGILDVAAPLGTYGAAIGESDGG